MSIKPSEYKDFIKKIVTNTGMYPDFELKEMDIPMSYSISTNTLRLNVPLIERVLSNKPYLNLTDEEVLTIMTCHEMGHMKDIRKNPEILAEGVGLMKNGDKVKYKEYLLQREEKAWEYGKQFVPVNLLKEYDSLNQDSINVYKSK